MKICHICLKKYNMYKIRRICEQFFFLKYENIKVKKINNTETNRLTKDPPKDSYFTSLPKMNFIEKNWGKAWHYYMFYDTGIYMENDLTKNYPLIPWPGQLPELDHEHEFIKVNPYVDLVIQSLYNDEFHICDVDYSELE